MVSFSPKSFVRKELASIPGWKTKRRIVVFESDDWGSIRMPSPEAFQRLEKSKLDLRSADAERFNLNDNLATGEDLGKLFEVLSAVKDTGGNHAVFTPVCIVANPDFERIRDSGYQTYFHEPFTETLKRFPGCENSFELWKSGIEKHLFIPQMHGREHLNVTAWMHDLQAGNEQALLAFKEGLWGFVPSTYPVTDYQAAFLLNEPGELGFHKIVIREGLQMFEELFGYRATFFVPPNGMFNNSLNRTLAENGIKFRYVSRIQNEPRGRGRSSRKLHYLGQRDGNGIRYIIRNCFFEPSQEKKDGVDACLNQIQTAFRWGQPAIIGSHRVNYIGSLNPGNRDRGLSQLKNLLDSILKNWPDTEFMSTAELGTLMNHGK